MDIFGQPANRDAVNPGVGQFAQATKGHTARNFKHGAPGLIWSTGLAKPPFVSTCSLWENTRSLSTYAFGRAEPAHPDAIVEGETKSFHHEQAFIRFRPYASVGGLDGRNPLPAAWMPTT